MSKYVGLRHFNHDELIFDTQETVVILRFIFKHKQPLIDRMEIDDKVRGLTQGLLVEAVDAPYSVSYVEALFKASISPPARGRRTPLLYQDRALGFTVVTGYWRPC